MTLMTTLELDVPIIQAPMAGGATTPELVATVSNFGALGSVGAGMTAPDVLNDQINTIKTLTDHPFMVNLMVLSEYESSTFDTAMPTWLSPYYQENGIVTELPTKAGELGTRPRTTDAALLDIKQIAVIWHHDLRAMVLQ